MGAGEEIEHIDNDDDVVRHVVTERIALASQLFDAAQYEDAVVAYKAALAMPEIPSELHGQATRGLEQSERGLAMQPLDLPTESSGEPQVLEHLLRSHLSDSAGPEEAAEAEDPQAQTPRSPDAKELEVVFEETGPIGILFEAASDYAPITVGEVKPASQAASVKLPSGRMVITKGLVLRRVQGQSIDGLKFQNTLELLQNQERPLSLTFDRGAVSPSGSPQQRPSPASPPPPVPPLSPEVSMRSTRDVETPFTRGQRDWDDAVEKFNKNASKGVKYMLELGLVTNSPPDLASLLGDEADRGLDKGQIGEYLSGGKPDEQDFRLAVRTAYLNAHEFTGFSFVTALRQFLRGFRLPGESMLIERIMSSFAARFYEQNPGYCDHLTDEKISELKEPFDEASHGDTSIGIHLVATVFRSLRSDFNYMKDAEIYDMMEVSPTELMHIRKLLEINQLPAEEFYRISETLKRATRLMKLETAAQVSRSQAEAAAVAAEQTAVLAAEANDSERMQLGSDARDRNLEAEYAETVAKSAQDAAAAAAEEFESLSPGFRIELPVFLAMVARKLGTDTMFVLAYSIIMLNTDAHNPRLSGSERISKAQFIENNRRSPDLAAISEVIMASLYDEIVTKEIKLKEEDENDVDTPGDDSALESESSDMRSPPPSGLLARFRGSDEAAGFDPADVGQKLYQVQQQGLRDYRGKSLPKKVKVGLTGMGLTVFDGKGKPLCNLLYQSMERWGVDRSLSGKVLGLRIMTDRQELFFKTTDGDDLCSALSQHSLAMKKAERQKVREAEEELRAAKEDLRAVTQAMEDSLAKDEEPEEVEEVGGQVEEKERSASPPPPPPVSPRVDVCRSMDAAMKAATLSAQRGYVRTVASTAGVDGAEVPRSGREAYIALHRVYNLEQIPAVEPAEEVEQIPLPPIDVPASASVLERAVAQVGAIEFEGLVPDESGNATATSETDSEDETAAVSGTTHEGEPRLESFYGGGKPMVRFHLPGASASHAHCLTLGGVSGADGVVLRPQAAPQPGIRALGCRVAASTTAAGVGVWPRRRTKSAPHPSIHAAARRAGGGRRGGGGGGGGG